MRRVGLVGLVGLAALVALTGACQSAPQAAPAAATAIGGRGAVLGAGTGARGRRAAPWPRRTARPSRCTPAAVTWGSCPASTSGRRRRALPRRWRSRPRSTGAGSRRWARWASARCASTRSTGRRSTPSCWPTTGRTRRAAVPGAGVYPPDESYTTSHDLFAAAPTAAFDAETRDAVAAVTGHLEREARPGRASGTWTADVSPYVMAWLAGAEMDPTALRDSDRRNARQPGGAGPVRHQHPGRDADRALAGGAARGARHRGAGDRPDGAAGLRELADHRPAAPPHRADRGRGPRRPGRQPRAADAGVGGRLLRQLPRLPVLPGLPALRAGVPAGHLRRPTRPLRRVPDRVRRHHATMPTLVTEFGVPSSIGSAHAGPLGRDQGDHSEREAMATDASLLREIKDLGLGAGFVFEWTDEWFKRPGTPSLASSPASARRCGTTRGPTSSGSAWWPPTPPAPARPGGWSAAAASPSTSRTTSPGSTSPHACPESRRVVLGLDVVPDPGEPARCPAGRARTPAPTWRSSRTRRASRCSIAPTRTAGCWTAGSGGRSASRQLGAAATDHQPHAADADDRSPAGRRVPDRGQPARGGVDVGRRRSRPARAVPLVGRRPHPVPAADLVVAADG